ncbi:MAG TPA: hypothetical protein VF371_03060 [Candidatus Limnocylindrales bacterium]
MTESKGVKPDAPEQPHKPAPKIVAVRPLPTDYQADPSDPFPIPTPTRARALVARSAARAGALAAKADLKGARARKSAAEASALADKSAAPGPVGPVRPAVAAPQAPVIRATRLSHSRDHKSLRIAHLYPSLLNVAGDGGNLIAIQRRAQWRGIPVDVVAVEKGDTPDFRKFDVVLFHGGQDVEMAIVAADFARKAPSLRTAVDEGVVIFAVCAGLQLLGHRYVSNAGEEMLGAGILDLETRGGPQRFMQHAACEVTIDGVTETVVGFENHSGLTTLGPRCQPFGRMVAGAGNNGRDGLEGARFGNVFATYLHGPCLPKNPWLTDQLIRIAVGRTEGISAAKVVLAPLNDDLERRAHEVALNKAMANRGHRTALEPAKLVRGQKIG